MKLYGNPGWGSAIVDLQLTWYGLAFEPVTIGNVFADAKAAASLRAVNPLAQMPTLILDDGTVLTESAAITLYLAELTGRSDLVPGGDSVDRARFLRWLIFLVTNIYPCFTFADDPARFVDIEAARAPFKAKVDTHAEKLWRLVEAEAGAPWFLGERMSAIDCYIAVMSRWRPKREWFADHAPKLHAIALRAEEDPKLAESWARNVPDW